MKVLIVSTFDISGGAALGAYHLCKSLRSNGVDAEMLVKFKASDDPVVLGRRQSFLREKLSWLSYHLDQLPVRRYPGKTRTEFSPAWLFNRRIISAINESDADLVNLHWITGGVLRIEDIARINKPIVWSLHDMWPFTGGCHYDEGCGKYRTGCKACPVLGSQRRDDLSASVFLRKATAYAKIPSLTVVGLSRWITDCAKNSALFSGRKIVTIPSLIDTTVFRPLDRRVARDSLRLPQNKKLVLFGGDGMVRNTRKGHRELLQALGRVVSQDVELVVFGLNNAGDSIRYPFPVHYLGHLPDDSALQTAYSAADVMVMPSLQEVLGWVSAESLSCGTPVVAFDSGGPRDIVDHKVSGYLAAPFEPASLAEGIDWVLNHPDPGRLAEDARQTVLDKFEAGKVARRYRELYRSIIGSS